ncbi:MAG: DUF992 domain-containing protein [Xanthobacteraceae bacterium]
MPRATKEKVMFRTLTIASVTAAALAAAAPALAQSGTHTGVLECTGGKNTSFIVGSTASLNCTFRPNVGGQESYTAAVRRVGLDVGFTDKSVVTWAVIASQPVARGGLAGSYGGVSANAAVGIGAGANALVGGSDKSITLQPLSVQGQTGLNVAAGVTSLELRAASSSKKKK